MKVTVEMGSKVVKRLLELMEKRRLSSNQAIEKAILDLPIEVSSGVGIRIEKYFDLQEELTATKEHLNTWKQAAKSHRAIQYKLRDELKKANELLKIRNQLLKETQTDCKIFAERFWQAQWNLEVSGNKNQVLETRLVRAYKVEYELIEELVHAQEVEKGLKEELKIADGLIETGNQLLEMIPACPAHGSQCIPHALDWVIARKQEAERCC